MGNMMKYSLQIHIKFDFSSDLMKNTLQNSTFVKFHITS